MSEIKVKGISILGAGGNSTGSDDCSATIDCLLKYKIGSTTEACTAIVNGSDDEVAQGTIEQKSSNDVITSLDTIVVPSGYYYNDVELRLNGGKLGEPTLTETKSEDGHSITITAASTVIIAGVLPVSESKSPFISERTVSASELVSNTYAVKSQGTHDITNYKNISVDVNDLTSGNISITSSGTKTVSGYKTASISASEKEKPQLEISSVVNNSVTITPYVHYNVGHIDVDGNIVGSDRAIRASDLVSGTLTVNANGTYSCTNYANVTVAIPVFTWS